MSDDFPFARADGGDCPNCGVEGLPTGLLGPADAIKCHNEDCPIRSFWGVHPAAPEWPGIGDFDVDAEEIVDELERDVSADELEGEDA